MNASTATPAVTRALAIAQNRARNDRVAQVRPIDLLHGLLAESEGRAASLLYRSGIKIERFHEVFGEELPIESESSVTSDLPFEASSRAILTRAQDLASELYADRALDSECLLITLLTEDGSIRKLLEGLGLVFSRFEEQCRAIQGPPLRLEEPIRLAEATEQIDAARILDASANRVREALRLLEDYCRFVLDDAFLCRQFKQMRHDLTRALAAVPTGLLVAARETLRDVGTEVSTTQEWERESIADVVQANCKRLQEALRSLEEYGKLCNLDLARTMESLRYGSYTLERALVLGTEARKRLANSRLCVLFTGSQCTTSLEWTIKEALAGGADLIQLREKSLTDIELLDRARQVRQWTRQSNVLFIVNDRPDIARIVEADGVHLGQDDMPIKEARRILGPNAIIGVSTHDLDQVHQAILDGASYIGVGPTFPSATKGFEQFPGLEFVSKTAAATTLPAFVIGGVNLDTITSAVAAGARRVAVSHAILQSSNPRETVQRLLKALLT